MHSHRTGAACCHAAKDACSSPPQDAELKGCAERARVVGFGAPVSVLVRPSAHEAPLLRNQVRARIAAHDRKRPRAGTPAANAWLAQREAWAAMLAGLGTDAEAPIEVLWPSGYAHMVLLGALREAVARLAPPSAAGDARSLRVALDTASACLATWEAFIAIDNGGLPDVAL